jgi:hypothetical protein
VDGDDGELEATVGESLDARDGGEVLGPLDGDVEAGEEAALEGGDHAFFGGEDVFDEDAGVLGVLGKRDDAGSDEVVVGERVGIEDVEASGDVGDEVLAVLVVLEVVAEEAVAFLLQVAGGRLAVAGEELVGVEEFAFRGLEDLEAFGRFDFLHFLKDRVAEGFFGVAEDVVGAHPADEDEADEEDDKDGPAQEVGAALGFGGFRFESAGGAPAGTVVRAWVGHGSGGELSGGRRGVGCLERSAAAAAPDGARVDDLEAGSGEVVDVVEGAAVEVVGAVVGDEDTHAVAGGYFVTVLALAHLHAVLQTSATTALDGEAETVAHGGGFFREQASQLFRCVFGYREHELVLWVVVREVK